MIEHVQYFKLMCLASHSLRKFRRIKKLTVIELLSLLGYRLHSAVCDLLCNYLGQRCYAFTCICVWFAYLCVARIACSY